MRTEGRRLMAGPGWVLALTSVASFMVSLDTQVVATALPVIRVHLHASLAALEWTVNAYTLSFAVLLLTGAAWASGWGGGACWWPALPRSPPRRPRARSRPTRAR